MEFADGDDLEFIEFGSKATMRLEKETECLTASCFAIAANNIEIRQRKSESMAKILDADYNNNFEFLCHLNQKSKICREEMRGCIESATQKSKTCIDTFVVWRSEVITEMGHLMDRDEFTMMPYDDVHTQIDQIDETRAKALQEINETSYKDNIKKGTLKDQYMQLQLDMDKLQIYVGEMRREKNIIESRRAKMNCVQ